MNRLWIHSFFLCTLWAAHSPTSTAALQLGQLDDFSVDLEGWRQGQPPIGLVGITRATSGGPDGIDDAFLRLQSDGIGSRGKLLAMNTAAAGFVSPWTGDYLAAGIEAISMDVNNLGATDLNLRLTFGTSTAPNLGGAWLASTDAIPVPVGSGWTRIQFSVNASMLEVVQGVGATFASIMTNVAALRILHANVPDNNGSSIVGILGIDNIFALGPAGVSGDYNDDSIVDAADYTVWRDMLGQTGVGLAADGTGPRGYPDGKVDTMDYDYWQANFDGLLAMGSAKSNTGESLQIVPEPRSQWLGCCAYLFLLTKHRKTPQSWPA